jgi:hypothetical protein
MTSACCCWNTPGINPHARFAKLVVARVLSEG